MGWIGLGPVGWVGGVRWGWVGSDGLGSLELGLVGLGWAEWIGLGLRGRAYRLPSMSARESTTSSRWRSGLRVIAAPKRRLSFACLGGAKNIPTLNLPFQFHRTATQATQFTAFICTFLPFLIDRPAPQRLIQNARSGTSINLQKKTTKWRQHSGTLACTRPRSCWRTRRSGTQKTGDYISCRDWGGLDWWGERNVVAGIALRWTERG